jgi:2-(3-amino-3-carboxypropyl)histidine synthase
MLVANYDLELERAVNEINEHEPDKVCLHMPDGIKPKANEIIDHLQDQTGVEEIMVWGGSCFGACDLPVEVKNIGVDLMIHWGHSRWKVTKRDKHPF